MKKREIFMLSSLTFSVGVIIGFMLSPIKKGIIVTGRDNIQGCDNIPKGDKTI